MKKLIKEVVLGVVATGVTAVLGMAAGALLKLPPWIWIPATGLAVLVTVPIVFWRVLPQRRSPYLALSRKKAKLIYSEHYRDGSVLTFRLPGSSKVEQLPLVVEAMANPSAAVEAGQPATRICGAWHSNAQDCWNALDRDHHYQTALQRYLAVNKRAVNGHMLRVMGVDVAPDRSVVTCHLMRSRYFYTVATNRMADLRLPPQVDGTQPTMRELFEPGPRLHSLSEARAGNHLGVNVMVLTRDGQLVFTIRQAGGVAHRISECDSTGSGALDWEFESRSGVSHAISDGAKRECRQEIGDIPLHNFRFLGLCRELERLGKPDAFFYAETPYNFTEVVEAWQEKPREWAEGTPLAYPFSPDEPLQGKRLMEFLLKHRSTPWTHTIRTIRSNFYVLSLVLEAHLALLGIYLGLFETTPFEGNAAPIP